LLAASIGAEEAPFVRGFIVLPRGKLKALCLPCEHFLPKDVTMNLANALRRTLSESDDEPSAAPNALDLLHSDHEAVAALFETALAEATPSAAKRNAIASVCAALTLHAKMEEKIFYPALRKAGKRDEKDSVLEAAEEHDLVKGLIAKIRRVTGRDETLAAKVTVLKELVEHHVAEEESTMFDEARKVLGSKLDALGAEMQSFKERAGGKGAKKPVARKKAAPSSKRR
jgi:hemerythrin superfamily protein